jgi:hypothetical protein
LEKDDAGTKRLAATILFTKVKDISRIGKRRCWNKKRRVNYSL